ncbi:MAG: hypothetical protein ACFFCS_00555 [Candidatus Hodarchaeota archaeon]
MESERISKKGVRENLKDVMKRYYELMDHKVREREKLLEVDLPRAKIQYVYDRKSAARHPKAEMISFNSEILDDIIVDIHERGRIAKAFIPFEFSPEESFKRAMEKLLTVIDAETYVLNGTIEFLDHHIEYVPFLMFIMKIEFSALESMVEIERAIIPMLEKTKLQELDKLNVSSISVEDYIKKLNSYFESSNPNLISKMPFQGEMHDISDEEILALSEEAIEKIQDKIEDQVRKTKDKLDTQLEKELNIIHSYYEQRLDELERSLDYAERKDDNERIKELREEVKEVRAERDFKNSEYESAYQVDINYNVLGAAIVYIPMIFYHKSRIQSNYGTIEKRFNYNFFDNELIPPLCPQCEKPIKRGIVCSGNHFVCVEHSYQCYSCGKLICQECGAQICRICDNILCEDHQQVCNHCEEIKRMNVFVCKHHCANCSLCGSCLCDRCSTTCSVCELTICEHNDDCSVKCRICMEPVCKEHSFECDHCKQTGTEYTSICPDHHKTCSICGASLCERCSTKCSTCHLLICEDNEECSTKCRICRESICKEHSFECDYCKKKRGGNASICSRHHYTCAVCGASLCQRCATMCRVCNQMVCENNKECSTVCKICKKPVCKEHSFECEPCKQRGKRKTSICTNHHATCRICGKDLCFSCFTKCFNCGEAVCTWNDDCFEQCDECKHKVCKDHISICPICDKKLCMEDAYECTTCHQVYCREHTYPFSLIGGGTTCQTCYHARKEKFYRFKQDMRRDFALPSSLVNSKIARKSKVIKIRLQEQSYYISKNQRNIKMGENKSFFIFQIKRPFENYCIVYNKETSEQVMFHNPGFFAKIKNFFKTVKPDKKIVLDKPSVIIDYAQDNF